MPTSDDLLQLLVAGLRSLDPAGVGPGAPADEYQPEAHEVMCRLTDARSAEDVEVLIHEVMARFFDPVTVGNSSQYHGLAENIWELAGVAGVPSHARTATGPAPRWGR